MIVPDTNLLVHAYNLDAPQNIAARNWWEGLVNGAEKVGVPWIVATGFIRVVSNDRITSSSLSPAGAADLVNDWFSYDHIVPIDPGPAHLDLFRRFLNVPGGGPNLVHGCPYRCYRNGTRAPRFTRPTGISGGSTECGGATLSCKRPQPEQPFAVDSLGRSTHGNRSHFPADRDRA